MTREPIGMNVGALRGASEEGRAMAVRPGAAPRRAGAVVAADGADDAELWLAYRRTGDPAIRNRLLSRNLGLVYHVARRMIRTLSTDVELRSEEHTSELQSRENLVCRLLLEKKRIKAETEQV